MLTHEGVKDKAYVSTMWRGIDDSSIEEVYYFLFHTLVPNTYTLPSVLRIEYVEPAILNHIKKECRGELVCATDCISTSKPKPMDNGDVIEDMIQDDDKTFLFVVRGDGKYPILVRLNTDRRKYEFCACSFDNDALNDFVLPIARKFAYRNDYSNEIVFGVLYPEGARLTIKELPLDESYVKKMDLTMSYGEGFVKHHETVLTKLNRNKRGLFILHGSPGTGKTTYIKYLAHQFGGKRMFIFIPTTNLETLVSPSLLPVLLDHRDSILVLEDAEKAVISREHQTGNESLVSTLLNIGDGILGSMLNLSLIVTFNTKKDKIDSALLRKGRLLYEYEFKPLSVSDAQRLIDKLGSKYKVTEPMTLADIYNISSDTGHMEEQARRIGF